MIESQRKRYMESVDSFKRNPKLHKHIYKSKYGTYSIQKNINGKLEYFGSFNNIHDAIEYRNYLIDNNWTPSPPSPEEKYEQELKEYYHGLKRTSNGRRYIVFNKDGGYLATIKGIEEALYYRDQYENTTYEKAPRPTTRDLETDNPYIWDGLDYPVPEKLIASKSSNYGEGVIRKKGEASYHVHHGKERYVCACRTYEQAYYVKQEMNKYGWDKTRLQSILDNYPKWYTRLLELYRYIVIDPSSKKDNDNVKYVINVPREYQGEDKKKIFNYSGYNNIEDALFERDFLVEHGWDYDELVEAIDDSHNPYYDMIIPPYPQRTIKNIRKRDYHEKELNKIYELLCEDPSLKQREIADLLGVTEVSLRNWLSKYWNSSYIEFKKITLSGENPLEVLEKVPVIYQPDLSKPKPLNFNGYIHYSSKENRSPYKIVKDNVRYGSYYTEEQAREAVKKLEACNWDKNKLATIQESVGWKPLPKRGNIYPITEGKSWMIRRKNKDRKMISYGSYKDYELAEIVRDMLIINNWDKKEYPHIREIAEEVLNTRRLMESNMFSGVYDYSYLEQLSICELNENERYVYYLKSIGKYTIKKTINGSLQQFGYYNTREEALEIREVLMDNDWDSTVLELIEEVSL